MNDYHATILLAEDHKALAETVTHFLENVQYAVDYAADGLTALHLGTVNRYDAIILDIMLPGMDGFDICHRLRQDAGIVTPIIMLTARDHLTDKLRGFREGADDYLVKPFDLPELDARLQALIRRQRGDIDEKVVVQGDLQVNTRTREVSRQGQSLHLTPTGYKILRILMRQSPNIVSREELEHELWGEMIPDSDTLRSHIYQLRKIVDKPFSQPIIQTLQGVGLRLLPAKAIKPSESKD